ncbi:MAG: tetratricopeptide repeat protein [Planctomycetes bacterium]|nr:tetratricopeptide repeat protein [Planctomycetota bacterium]
MFRTLLILIVFSIVLSVNSLWAASFKRIGILDFANLTGSEEHDWVCEAFRDALKRKFQRVVELNVMQRSSLLQIQQVRKLSGKKIDEGDASECAKLAGLDFLVFGSVQSSGEVTRKNAPLRVHARLVDTMRGVIHQAVIVDGVMSDIFDLQFKLAHQFVDLARIEVSLAEVEAMKSNATLDIEAYRLYHLGMLEKRQKHYQEAIALFEKSMAKHSGILYADPHHQIGQVYIAMGKKKELVARFRGDVARLAPVYYDLGVAYKEAGEYDKAIDAFRTFVEASYESPIVWELKTQSDNFELLLSKESKRAVLVGEDSIQGVNTMTGERLWTNERKEKDKHAQYEVVQEKLIVRTGKESRQINMNTGQYDLKGGVQVSYSEASESEDIVIALSESMLEVKDAKGSKTLWQYEAQSSDKIMAHDGDSFFVRRGKHRIRALSIKRGHIPGQLEGLVELGACLDKAQKSKESIEVYRYILDHIDNQHPLALEKVLP